MTSPPPEFSDVQLLPLEIEIEHAERVNFALHQNRVRLVSRLSLTNTGDEALADLRVQLSLANGEAEPTEEIVSRIGPGETYNLEPTGPRLAGALLAARTERERTELIVRVGCEGAAGGVDAAPGAEAAASRRVEIDLLPFDHWGGLSPCPELLAAFVTPNHPALPAVLRGAREVLQAAGERDAIDGYQAASRSRAVRLAEVCFVSLAGRDIGYINPPASFERSGQRIRLADRVFREGLGTCLDLSLLLAGLWEQAGLNPLIVLFEDHALPAFWTRDEHFPEPAIDEPERLRKGVGLGELVVVESTVLTQRGGTFAAAVEAANRKLDAAGEVCAVDIRTARRLGVRPLPLRVEHEETTLDPAAVAAAAAREALPASLDAVKLAERAGLGDEAGGDGSGSAAEPGNRVDRWKRKLLDLSLRNRLLNFRETKRVVELSVPDLAMLEDRLADGASFDVLPRSDRRGAEHGTAEDAERAFREAELAEGRLFTTLTEAETSRRLLEIYRASRSSIEETGANVLYIALGMLRWLETPAAEKPRRSPLILLPVTLVRRSAGGGYRYRVELTSEPLRPNITLIEKLRVDFGFDVRALDDMPEDDRGLDVPMILRRFRQAIRDAKGWEIEETAHLGLFSFSKFLMWHDLQHMGEAIGKQKLLGRLLHPAETDDGGELPDPAQLDEAFAPGDLLCTRDADSSQLVAVRAAREGRTFVLEGPPGTGKSQTIANIIADALGNGKRVLFVAEKMAALSVVRRRLGRDGLGPFCLELHSARASKKEVLRQLGEALDAARIDVPSGWAGACGALQQVRQQLNMYVRELHELRESGESVYQMIGRLSALGDGERVDLGIVDCAGVSAGQLQEWRTRVSTLTDVAGAVDPVGEHPLRGIGRAEWSFALPDEARAALGAAVAALAALRSAAARFAAELLACAGREADEDVGTESDAEGVVASLSEAEVGVLGACAAQLGSCPLPPRGVLDAAASEASAAVLGEWISRGRQTKDREAALLERYRPELFDADLLGMLDAAKQARGKPGVVRWFFAGKARKRVRPYCTGSPGALDAIVADLEEALSIAAERRELSRPDSEAARCFGAQWRSGDANFDELDRVLAWSVRFRHACRGLLSSEGGRRLCGALADVACEKSLAPIGDSGVGVAAGALVNAQRAWAGAWGRVHDLLEIDAELAWSGDASPGWIGCAGEAIGRWAESVRRLNDWCAWRREREAACASGLGALVNAYERGRVERRGLLTVFERSFGERWLVQSADASEPIRGFNARAHTSAIERFRELDKEVIRLTRQVVVAGLAERLPGAVASVSSSSEVGILRRELEKRSRHMPTRRLIEALPNLLPRLKPCFLMSPLSVAQYLDPEQPAFDLVVFDEASQIPAWDAIGSIARGTDVIIVGDSKQLPPTNFFGTVDSGDDDDSLVVPVDDELESILQECNASGVPGLRLRWHYRSRHESLIAFSNHHYYNDELHTFPSPVAHSPELGVSFHLVEGAVYERGGSRTNRVEAEAVVAEVVRRLGEPGATGSIGVVTFNAPQQGLIEDLFDEARREHPEIEPFFAGVEEPVFVKNLENVQGDERDTIIFSVGYGPDDDGRMSMNFGPLNVEGGERRLNVAVTRSRYRLLVFCSMQPEAIDLSRTRATGVHHFKRFLMYAQRGPGAMAESAAAHTGASTPSELESAVRAALEARGWGVESRVGLAGYRVDLAIVDPERPGEFLIGIECDGPMYRNANTARDRDRTRSSVLGGLGWRLVRVWSTAWRLDPEGCLGQIEDAIAQAKAERDGTGGADEPEPGLQPASGVLTSASKSEGEQFEAGGGDESSAAADTYRPAKRPRGVSSRSDIYESRTDELAVRALAAIVEQEGPIVPELALRRLAEWFGVSRITDRYRERFQEILGRAAAARVLFARGDAFWAAGAHPERFDKVRTPGDDDDSQRDVEWVPLVERAAAVRQVLGAQIALPREELERESAKLLGFGRATTKTREAMAEAIDLVLVRGEATEADGRVVMP
ncbi:MAG: DUF4011 domain-containing protein [Planctomycetota bacterium]|nr:DUF4011 domain-containing protein [Planctomycetota bacterium]